jgi:gamma-glutamylputrescine oxidase
VLASNVFIDGLALDVARRVMSVGGTIIATEHLSGDLVAGLLRDGYAACDTNFLLDYYRVTPDNRVLWGGGSTYLRHDPPSRIGALREKMVRIYPQLEAAAIEFAWGGLIDATASRAPDFGCIDGNLIYLQGFSGHGLNVTAVAGRLAAEIIDGQPERFNLLARLKHRPFPGGPGLRRAALSIGTWYYRGRDLLAL